VAVLVFNGLCVNCSCQQLTRNEGKNVAISAYCSYCRSTSSLTLKFCQKCGEPLTGDTRAYRVRVKTPSGWKSRVVSDLKEARALEREFQGDEGAGRGQRQSSRVSQNLQTRRSSPKSTEPTFTQVWEQFYPWVCLRIKDPAFYENKWRNHIAPAFANRTLESVTTNELNAFFAKLRQSPVAPMPFRKAQPKLMAMKTALDIVKAVGRLYSYAIEDSDPPMYAGSNPFRRFKPPKFNNKVTNDLNLEQTRRLIEVLDGWDNRPAALAFKLSLMTGKRTGEVFSLVWRNVDLEVGFIRFIVKSQTKDDVQHYPISPGVRLILEEALKLPRMGSGLVFPSEVDKVILYPKIWDRIKIRARIPKETRAHDLRHTFASRLLSERKATLAEVQKLLNHKSPQMTERYAHLADDAMRRAAQAADEIFDAKHNVN